MSNKGVLRLDKWNFKFGIIPIYWRPGWKMFHFGIFKIVRFPPEGALFEKSHYKGFWYRKELRPWDGFEITL